MAILSHPWLYSKAETLMSHVLLKVLLQRTKARYMPRNNLHTREGKFVWTQGTGGQKHTTILFHYSAAAL